jgi:hypothetical protein
MLIYIFENNYNYKQLYSIFFSFNAADSRIIIVYSIIILHDNYIIFIYTFMLIILYLFIIYDIYFILCSLYTVIVILLYILFSETKLNCLNYLSILN